MVTIEELSDLLDRKLNPIKEDLNEIRVHLDSIILTLKIINNQ